MVGERLLGVVGLLCATVLVGAMGRFAAGPSPAYAAVTLPGTASDQLAVAADALEAAMAKGGPGLTFEVVQRNTLHAKTGGPLIGVRDPADPARVVAEVDTFTVSAIVSRGAITADAFWMEMRVALDKAAPDFGAAGFFARVLERDGVIWRDDGDGWYLTDISPGTGMDPVSARLLPTLLRSAAAPATLQPELVEGRLLPGVRGTASVADYPGVVASDGKDFTDPAFEVRYWLDEAGRLVRLETSARNRNESDYDLVATTIVTFGYGSTGDPPTTSPTMGPGPTPEPEPEAVEVAP
jgi:hypothetical protein